MNKEKINIELSRISTPTGITPSGDYTLDDYTCDEILDYINEQDQENTNLKQALNKIRKIINDKKEPFNWEYPDTNFWLNHNNIKDILQIIDEALGDDDSENNDNSFNK